MSLDRPTAINYVDLADALGGVLGSEQKVLELARLGEAQGMTSVSARLEAVVGAYEEWMHVEDTEPLYATLGGAAARNLPGDPIWLILIGAPSSGKTETVLALTSVSGVKLVSTVTEGGLLSGTARRDKAKDATGGLLEGLDSGLLLLKDFTSVLSLNNDTRLSLLAALREIYDGKWVRHVGVDGGRELAWEGKLGVVAASTGIIDRHHAVTSQMGERFLFCRLQAATRRRSREPPCARTGVRRSSESGSPISSRSCSTATCLLRRDAVSPRRSGLRTSPTLSPWHGARSCVTGRRGRSS